MAQHSVPNRQARRPHGIFPVGGSTTVIEEDRKENTVWDVYNNEARKVDIELVKDWSENLNSLLIFAAIFAAVLTAFVIESKSLLEPDQGEILVDLAILFFNEMRNASSATNATISRPDFTPTSEAITINCLLFGSLGASLFAALASVVALQWVGDYDAAITRGGSSPEDRAKRRQFHYAGVVDWKMGHIIALLPVLLYASVALFWAGLVLWIWTVHRTVAAVVMGGTVLAAVFYVTTTLLAAMFVSAPFRTPLSRGVYWACQPFVSLVHRILRSRLFLHLIYSTKESLRITAPVLFQPPLLMAKMYTEYLPRSKFITWLQRYILPQDTAARREERYLDRDPLLGQEALCWLANQVSISENSHYRLLLLVGEFQTYACQEKVSPNLAKAPWWKIFDCLGWYHLRRTFDCALFDEDKGAIEILLQCVKVETIGDEVLGPLGYRPNAFPNTDRSEYDTDRKTNAVFLLVPEISDTLAQETMKPWYPEVRKAVSSVLRTLVNHGDGDDRLRAAIPPLMKLTREQNSNSQSNTPITTTNETGICTEVCDGIRKLTELLLSQNLDVRTATFSALSELEKLGELQNEIRSSVQNVVPSLILGLQSTDLTSQSVRFSLFFRFAQQADCQNELQDSIRSLISSLIEQFREGSTPNIVVARKLHNLAKHASLHDEFCTALPSLIELFNETSIFISAIFLDPIKELLDHPGLHDSFGAAIPPLLGRLREGSFQVKYNASKLLLALAASTDFCDDFRPHIPSLISWFRESSFWNRVWAVDLLLALGQHEEFHDQIDGAFRHTLFRIAVQIIPFH